MPGVEPRCVNQSNAIQNLPCLAVLKRGGVERHTVFFYSLDGAAVNQAILARQLHRVHIAARQL
jgi:hypothetical protein